MPSSLGMEEKIESNYYSPDFDYKKVPKKLAEFKADRLRKYRNIDRQPFEVSNHMQIRTMAPFNIRCNGCGQYTNKGSKIQSNVDKMPGMMYLNRVTIWRFHVRCPCCRSVIVFRTDPENQDYEIVSGGTRSFRSAYVRAREAIADEEAEKEIQDNNPMKLLEDRTFASKRELEAVELLEDLQDVRRRPNNTDATGLLEKRHISDVEKARILLRRQHEEDEDEINTMLLKQNAIIVQDEIDDDDNDKLKPKLSIRIGEECSSSRINSDFSETGTKKGSKSSEPKESKITKTVKLKPKPLSGIKIGVKRPYTGKTSTKLSIMQNVQKNQIERTEKSNISKTCTKNLKLSSSKAHPKKHPQKS